MTPRKSWRVRVTSPQTVTVPVGRGVVDLPPGYAGPVVPAVAAWLQARPGLAEVWSDGEPPAPGQARAPETVADVRVTVTEDGARFEEIETREPPPLDAPPTLGGFEGAD
jgi:hypothetical protein